MTAGSVAVPTIIPLRFPVAGTHKTAIDSNTKIELRTETKDAVIYYTINGTKPDPFQKFGDRCTMRYRGPFTLPAGKQTVKAIGVVGDGERQSAVVTKTFEVDYAPPPEVAPVDDEMGFQDDLERERSKMRLDRARTDLLRSTNSAWTDVAATKQMQQSYTDAHISGSSRRKAPVGARFSESRRNLGSTSRSDMHQLSNGSVHYDIRPSDERLLPDEYTTEAIQALQTMSLKNKRDFLNFTTTTEGQYPGAHQWIPPAYPPQSFRAPPTTYMPQSPDIDIALVQGLSTSKKPETKSVAVQTAGLFYPSQAKIDQMQKELEDKMTFEKQMRDRRPLLSAVSPGKGFWRKQIDHICQHLKAHAQNDAEFRALIGDPKMGRMLTSSVQEDGYELSLTLTFALRDNKDPFAGRKLGISTHKGYLSQRTAHDSLESGSEDELIMSDDNITSRSVTSSAKKRGRKARAKKKPAHKISPLDAKLIKELSSNGEGSSTEVQQLIDEGANHSCESKSGLPALHLAAKNKHIDCIPVLVQAGADVNAKGPSSIKGNTALHEAVALGPSGVTSVEALLSCGADQNIKNERGETPYDMATKGGYDNIIKRFAAALGQSQLQKMIRPRSSAE
ncbi:hypothetical protein BaRGS_00031286 [Batillaria attramentaria]|uniref:Ankyrin repeat protein n=1 Tax=Batillaria attramentaria TaxID=370345 RepID=A0ABD0JRF0_9CAEN